MPVKPLAVLGEGADGRHGDLLSGFGPRPSRPRWRSRDARRSTPQPLGPKRQRRTADDRLSCLARNGGLSRRGRKLGGRRCGFRRSRRQPSFGQIRPREAAWVVASSGLKETRGVHLTPSRLGSNAGLVQEPSTLGAWRFIRRSEPRSPAVAALHSHRGGVCLAPARRRLSARGQGFRSAPTGPTAAPCSKLPADTPASQSRAWLSGTPRRAGLTSNGAFAPGRSRLA